MAVKLYRVRPKFSPVIRIKPRFSIRVFCTKKYPTPSFLMLGMVCVRIIKFEF